MGNKTIFERKTQPVAPQKISQPKPIETKQRKKRSDAKNDIKFKLSEDEKRHLKRLANNRRISLTAFISELVQHDLSSKRDYEHFEYDQSGLHVHAVLEDKYFEMVLSKAAEWDTYNNHVVHRIVRNFLNRELISRNERMSYKIY